MKNIICITLIVLLQILVTMHFSVQKSGYHVDEMYTYTLSNYAGGFVTEAEGVLEGWKTGEFYKEVLEVSEKEAFSYNIPYQNQRGDVHPPLYYFVIHTFSSLVSGTFSKWIGISVNIIFNALTALVLFWVSKEICENTNLALVITGVWALSNGVIESGIFARMYAMLTFFAIVLVALHIKAYRELKENDKFSLSILGLLFGCTLLGVLTQYYYMVFCFFLCGIFAFYLLCSKKWNTLVQYVVAEFGALAAAVVCFPYMLKHIFSGYRGKQAFQSALDMQGYKDVLKNVTTFISKDLFNGLGEEITLLLVLVVVVIVVRNRVINKKMAFLESHVLVILLATVGIGYMLVIAKIAPFQANRYFMCIYPLLTLALVSGVYYIIALNCFKHRILIVGIIWSVITVSSFFVQDIEYLYSEGAKREDQLAPYQGMPAIILNGLYDYAPDNWLYEFGNYDAVYRCAENGDLQGLENAIATYDLADGFLVYAYGMPEKDEELLKKIQEHINVERFEKITNIYCRVFFCTLHEN